MDLPPIAKIAWDFSQSDDISVEVEMTSTGFLTRITYTPPRPVIVVTPKENPTQGAGLKDNRR